MDVKEKLVELIAQKVCNAWSEACDEWMPNDCGKCYANDCHIAEVADHLIAHGVTVRGATDSNVGRKWISVKDRLPQDDLPFGALCEIVQVLLDDGTVTVGWCNRGLKCWYYMPINAANFVGHDYENTPVVAWQPLAQPPKGE